MHYHAPALAFAFFFGFWPLALGDTEERLAASLLFPAGLLFFDGAGLMDLSACTSAQSASLI